MDKNTDNSAHTQGEVRHTSVYPSHEEIRTKLIDMTKAKWESEKSALSKLKEWVNDKVTDDIAILIIDKINQLESNIAAVPTTAAELEALKEKLKVYENELGMRYDATDNEGVEFGKVVADLERVKRENERLNKIVKREAEIGFHAEKMKRENERLREAITQMRADAKIAAEHYMAGYVNLSERDNGFRSGYQDAHKDFVERLTAALTSESEEQKPTEI